MPYVVFCVSPYPSLLLSTISTNFMKKPKLKKKLKPNGRKHHGKMPKEVTHTSHLQGSSRVFCFFFINIFTIYLQNTHTYLPTDSQQKNKQQPFVHISSILFMFLSVSLKKKNIIFCFLKKSTFIYNY